MNEPPGARARVALTGLTVAEYFRDQEGQDVSLIIFLDLHKLVRGISTFRKDTISSWLSTYFGD